MLQTRSAYKHWYILTDICFCQNCLFLFIFIGLMIMAKTNLENQKDYKEQKKLEKQCFSWKSEKKAKNALQTSNLTKK